MPENNSIELDERFVSAICHLSEDSMDKAETQFSLLLAESTDKFELQSRIYSN